MAYCQSCGKEVGETANFCASCGTRLSPLTASTKRSGSKNKLASILLAVFLGFWTWLYTYKRDVKKFWIGLSIYIVAFVIFCAFIIYFIISIPWSPESTLELTDTQTGMVILFWILLVLIQMACNGIWIWAIIDTAIKKDEWYRDYQLLQHTQ